jgi:hypothetical protein
MPKRGVMKHWIFAATFVVCAVVATTATRVGAAKCLRVGQKRSQIVWIGNTPKTRQIQVCTRVGKRLIWKLPQTNGETAGNSIRVGHIPEITEGNFNELSECQVNERSGPGPVLRDPPYSPSPFRNNSIGKVRVLMLPVDFVDAPASTSSNPESDFANTMKQLPEYFAQLSGGRLGLTISTLPAYLRMDKPLESWGLGGSWQNRDQSSFVRDVVRATDSRVDFTEVDYLIVAPAPTYSLSQIASGREGLFFRDQDPLLTNEGRIRFANIDSTWMSNAHEISHSLGLPDLYDIDFLGSGNVVGLFRFVGYWDHMGSLANRGLLGWNRYFLGWLSPSEVKCAVGSGIRRLKLSPLGANSTKPEMLLLRGDSGAVLGLEVRRFNSVMDDYPTVSTQGVLVYLIDNTKGHARGTISVLGPGVDPTKYHASAPLRPGQSLIADGWTIKVIDSDIGGDLIEIVKD